MNDCSNLAEICVVLLQLTNDIFKSIYSASIQSQGWAKYDQKYTFPHSSIQATSIITSSNVHSTSNLTHFTANGHFKSDKGTTQFVPAGRGCKQSEITLKQNGSLRLKAMVVDKFVCLSIYLSACASVWRWASPAGHPASRLPGNRLHSYKNSTRSECRVSLRRMEPTASRPPSHLASFHEDTQIPFMVNSQREKNNNNKFKKGGRGGNASVFQASLPCYGLNKCAQVSLKMGMTCNYAGL